LFKPQPASGMKPPHARAKKQISQNVDGFLEILKAWIRRGNPHQ